ncbi:hypothetical protein GGTG_04654 [Gaeumannomyces tritici R3-111a-1]|uniref:Uncharacterized protein n=1 Tax=Gaeumannomyces tritici (strain R3-111a-1) TaxID=644352 RepID=J3NTQ4_GAET3|nr:hypothetical protein GGTG_04654 [Gaeumannomyces tritici R3-111a-1]EJT79569.1 hypothetical protein GGTG_04654 [Gaeumannomyces tritici R3-111a-1]
MALRLDEAAFVFQRLVEISHRGRRFFGAPEGTQFETDPPLAFVLMTTCVTKMHLAHRFRPTRGIEDRQMKLRKALDFFPLLQLMGHPGHRQRQQQAQLGAVLCSLHRALEAYMAQPPTDGGDAETVRVLGDMERDLVSLASICARMVHEQLLGISMACREQLVQCRLRHGGQNARLARLHRDFDGVTSAGWVFRAFWNNYYPEVRVLLEDLCTQLDAQIETPLGPEMEVEGDGDVEGSSRLAAALEVSIQDLQVMSYRIEENDQLSGNWEMDRWARWAAAIIPGEAPPPGAEPAPHQVPRQDLLVEVPQQSETPRPLWFYPEALTVNVLPREPAH